MDSPGPAPNRLPFIVPLLALGTFLMCTTEYIVAGLLEQMADNFGVRTSQVGLLITAFAVGMIVGAPLMAVATLRLPKRATLVLSLAIFAAGHVLAALSDSFTLVLAARVLTAVVTGAFWSVASVVATTAAGPAASSRALGVMMSGVGLATVLGVPLGSLAGEHLGWRGAFWGLAVLAAGAAVVIGRFVPATAPGPAPSVVRRAAGPPQRTSVAGAFTVSAFNAGIAAGSAVAGYALDSPLGTTGPATVGIAMVTLSFVPLIALGVNRTPVEARHEPATA